MRVAVVVPVYGNEATLRPLAERLAAALAGRTWRLRLVLRGGPGVNEWDLEPLIGAATD